MLIAKNNAGHFFVSASFAAVIVQTTSTYYLLSQSQDCFREFMWQLQSNGVVMAIQPNSFYKLVECILLEFLNVEQSDS